MREIKFRAWNCETKRYDPCFYLLSEGDGIINEIIGIEDDNGNEQLIEHGEVILQQFTGLKDKDGREIYEGDIVFIDDSIGKIGWNNEALCFCIYFLMEDGGFDDERLCDYIKDIEVIGNIYENPDLLE